MMRKLAIASLLVAGVALSGSVFAQDSTAAAPASSSTSSTSAKHATTHTHKAKSTTGTKNTHKAKKSASSAPASSGTAGK